MESAEEVGRRKQRRLVREEVLRGGSGSSGSCCGGGGGAVGTNAKPESSTLSFPPRMTGILPKDIVAAAADCDKDDEDGKESGGSADVFVLSSRDGREGKAGTEVSLKPAVMEKRVTIDSEFEEYFAKLLV
eukprot:SM000063S20075  [mRNA]  locus=s63:661177:661713:- [translate_table: standard]